MITEIEDYFTMGCGRCDKFGTPECVTRGWLDGLTALRRICRDMGLTETVKWGHPCYMHAGRNIVLIGALRGNFRMSFFKAALMKDPAGILERQGPNTQNPDVIRFDRNEQVAELEPVLRTYLAEAMSYAEAGIVPERKTAEFDLPDELAEALDADPELAEGFHALTPGRQRSYVINLNGAKKAETRIARIAKFRPHILAGKGATER
jgi:uncharacterized protein YdeI (YjbR/CyaY-like superfamily)